MRIHADELTRDWPMKANTRLGRWTLARPINYRYESIVERVRNAWAVLVGRADALVWESPDAP